MQGTTLNLLYLRSDSQIKPVLLQVGDLQPNTNFKSLICTFVLLQLCNFLTFKRGDPKYHKTKCKQFVLSSFELFNATPMVDGEHLWEDLTKPTLGK